MNQIGKMIKQARLAAGLTVRDLGKLSGVSYSLISRLETGTRTPPMEFLLALAKTLDIDPVAFHKASGLIHPAILDLIGSDRDLLRAAFDLAEAVKAGRVDVKDAAKALKALAGK